jgi:4'-phosphopantetheinyl transferase
MSTRLPAREPAPRDGHVRWLRGPSEPLLADTAVHVWHVDLTTVDDGLADSLSAAERERALGIADEDARRLWRRSRGVLRELLARYLRERSGALALGVGRNGKPRLTGGARQALSFNLSHSRQLCLYAFTAVGSVGIDIEVVPERSSRGGGDRVTLARRAFGEPHARRLRALTPAAREREFLRLWTRHEAELKYRGVGLGAARVEDRARGEASPEPWIVELEVGPRAVAALASERAPEGDLRLWRWA